MVATLFKAEPDGTISHPISVGADLDFGFRWELETGESIANSTWEHQDGVTLTRKAVTDNVASAFAKCAAAGSYWIRNTIVTSEARTDVRTLILHCRVRGI